uniref:Tudor domain-containing protein 1 n=1 Tax=Lygus hesperus TaxID=30085 RepID=A0A0A9WC19_LYGHE
MITEMESDNDNWRVDDLAISMNDYLKLSIDRLGIILRDLREDPNRTPSDRSNLLDVNSLCFEFACKVSELFEKKFPTMVPWLPEDKSQLKRMTLFSSKSPWSVVLTYPLPDVDLLKNYTEESLTKFIETPQIGCFVCVSYRRKLFRGQLLGMLSYNRLKVLNIDTNEIFIIPTSSIFHMPPDVCSMHALALNCSMMEEDEVVEKLWSEDLQAIFTRALEECTFEVGVGNAICDSPPKYLVDVVGTNSEGLTISLTDWLHNTLIPDMKQSFHLLTAKEELLYFLKDESIDPFCVSQVSSSNNNTSLSIGLYKEQLLSSLCSIPPPSTGPSLTNEEDSKERLLSSLLSLKKGVNKMFCDEACATNHELSEKEFKNEASYIDGDQRPFSQVKNRITLPGIGERANVVITHVLSSLSFYVVLEEKYSDFVDQRGTESYTTLIKRMNHPLNFMKYTPLPVPPSLGQLVAFRSQLSSPWFRGKLSRTWLRGVVTHISKDSVTVLNPDLGQSEIVRFKDLRSITEENTILPFQAILTSLHNIRFADHINDQARDYFMQLTASKKLQVLVQSVNSNKSAIEVELFTSDGANINNALVASGLCVQVCPARDTF